jgi:hypothetical protein
MKNVIVSMLALCSASSFALECKYDRSAADGGSSSIQITENANKTYRISLSRQKPMSTQADSVVYDQATCATSKSNPMLMSCMVPFSLDGISGTFPIETRLSYNEYFGDMLTVVVDPSATIQTATGGVLSPTLKQVSSPVANCKI